jgi:argininosuccinate lyase
MPSPSSHTLWGANFSVKPDATVLGFTSGYDMTSRPACDTALVPYDLAVNTAHALMLGKTGIIPACDAAKILIGLQTIKNDYASGVWTLDPSLEDVHTAIEMHLTKLIGSESAGKLHTARSRNDQVVTDMQLYMNDVVLHMAGEQLILASTCLSLASNHISSVLPGMTHHQHAMVSSFGHILASWGGAILRDTERLLTWCDLHNVCPLGSSASYGTQFSIDRATTAQFLGFSTHSSSSLDGITNRFESESDLVYDLTIMMNHLSSMAETLIMYSMPEFGYVTLADGYSTGSSIMPQKKNPDPLEVIKAKTSSVQGKLSSLISLGKANFIGYNRDSQWTKYLLMDAVGDCLSAPSIMSSILTTMTVHTDHMAQGCATGFLGAASLMESLIIHTGLPMRTVKVLVETAVKLSFGDQQVTYSALLQAATENNVHLSITAQEVQDWQDPMSILSRTNSPGGPGATAVAETITAGKKRSIHLQTQIDVLKKKKSEAETLLQTTVLKFINKEGQL